MHKFFVRILLIFLVCSPGFVYSQTRTDPTVRSGDSVLVETDSLSSVFDSSGVTMGSTVTYAGEDSLYMPVKDSSYLNAYAPREVLQSKVSRYLADRDYEYANDPAYWKKDKIQNNSGPSLFTRLARNKVFQWILFLLVIAVVIYGIFQLARENNFRWFSRQSEQRQEGESDSLLQGPENYDEVIRKYQAEGNYRFAIRYLFLRLIHSAADKNIIRIQDSTTNAQIGRAFSGHPLASQYQYLATAYEYIYFGDFNLNEEIYDSLKRKFELFQEKISS
jgi:hypothetical protein